MEPKDILLKEYDAAWQRFVLDKESKQKTVRLFVGVISAIAVFLIKGDISLGSLVYVPPLELVFLIYLLNKPMGSDSIDIL